MKIRKCVYSVLAVAGAVACFAFTAPASADSVVLTPVQDNSMYENFGGEESNGAGIYLFSGRTGCCGVRRALLQFDIAGNIPAGATIDSVTLQLNMSKAPLIVNLTDLSLHPVTAAWGEGTSDAGDPGGFGAGPTPGDATWAFRLFNTDAWTTPGGDFGGPSATLTVDNLGFYTWGSSAALVADVQSWLDAPAGNFGWLLKADDETATGNARRFDSRENPDPSLQPQLTVEFTSGPVCGDGVVDVSEECDDGNLVDGDGCNSACELEFCGDGIVQAGLGEECDDAGETVTCDADCTIAFCGDAVVNATANETCDPPGIPAGEPDECRDDCTFCGDSAIQPGEDCDGGGESATCDDDCSPAVCGDGQLNTTAGEQCDDGNMKPGDGCEPDCTLPVPVPTVSEWGLILMALLLLSAGTLVFSGRLAGATGTGRNAMLGSSLISLGLYLQVLAGTLALLALGLVAAWLVAGPVSAVDVAGSFLCAPLVAYLAHLWIPASKE